jgi:polyisoprenoid-binding protein YceI
MKIAKYLTLALLATTVMVSCGETTAEATTVENAVEVVEEAEVIVTTYNVDTAQTSINWRGYEEMGVENPEFHEGTLKALNGSVELTETDGEMAITNASFAVDMNSIKESNGLTKLDGHLMSADFFNVNEFVSTVFTFEKHEEGMLHGKVNVAGADIAIVAPVVLEKSDAGITINVEAFRMDVTPANLPFFVAEAENPEHDPSLEFNLVVIAK